MNKKEWLQIAILKVLHQYEVSDYQKRLDIIQAIIQVVEEYETMKTDK